MPGGVIGRVEVVRQAAAAFPQRRQVAGQHRHAERQSLGNRQAEPFGQRRQQQRARPAQQRRHLGIRQIGMLGDQAIQRFEAVADPVPAEAASADQPQQRRGIAQLGGEALPHIEQQAKVLARFDRADRDEIGVLGRRRGRGDRQIAAERRDRDRHLLRLAEPRRRARHASRWNWRSPHRRARRPLPRGLDGDGPGPGASTRDDRAGSDHGSGIGTALRSPI